MYTQSGALESKTTSAYDPRGRKTSESWQVNGVTYTLSYSYDPAGNMVSMTYPDGVSYQFVYDDWNRLVAIPGLFGENVVNPGFRYGDTGFLERIARANGITTVITPDVRMRPVSIQDSALTLNYTYDGEGNVTSQNGLAYAYDGLDRLISAQVPGASGGTRTVAYAYDRVGNRLSETWDGGATKTYTYSPGNYLTQAGGMTYSYGAFGELRQKQASGTTTEYIYDGSRRMAQVKTGGTEVARYIYDALGRRISATSGGVTRVSLYLGNDIVYEAGGGTITKYVVAGGKYLAKVVTQAQAGAAGTLGAAAVVTPAVEPPDGSTSRSTSTKTPPGYIPPPDDQIIIIEPPIIYPPPPDEPPGEEPPPQEPPPSEPQPPSSYGVFYFHTDLVGSIRAVTDSQGQVVARYEYEPFGLTVKAEGPLAGHDVHKFTGKPEDAATGLYYFNARYYDPEVGRFTTQDPLGDGPNLYAYCYQNPLRYVDPAGLRPLDNPGGSHDNPETDDDFDISTDYMEDVLRDYDEVEDAPVLHLEPWNPFYSPWSEAYGFYWKYYLTHQEAPGLFVPEPGVYGHVDVGVSWGSPLTLGFGLVGGCCVDSENNVYVYAGGGWVGNPSFSLTQSCDSISPGLTAAVARYGPFSPASPFFNAYQKGWSAASGSRFSEVGWGTPGFQAVVFHVWKLPVRLRFSF